MPITELSDYRNWVETSVLRERRRDDLQRIRICLETVCLHTLEGVGVLRE